MNKQSIIEAAEKKYPDGENMAQIKRAAYIAGATDHPCAGRWVKASEIFPNDPNEKVFRRRQGTIYQYIQTEDFEPEYLVFNGEEIYYTELEYLDESPSPESIERVKELEKEVERLKAELSIIEERENNPYWYWPQCDVEGCDGVSCCGGGVWAETGYWSVCSKHSDDYRNGKPQPKMKQESIDREASRDKDGILPISALSNNSEDNIENKKE